jgi:type IV secretion system protein VirB6
MACPSVITGDRFLTRALDHLDCQAQVIGSYGYSALGQPGSLASLMVTGLLTLFVAFYAFRFLFGPGPSGRDTVQDALKIGIVLTLAFSWPAFRTVVYDLVLHGPAQIAALLGNASSLEAGSGLIARLQAADDTLVRLIEIGTGRTSGVALGPQGAGPVFAGSALQDDAATGYARLVFLSSTLGSLALLRLLAGVLLALTPIVAGLLLFDASRGIFAGWLRGLVLAMAGSIGLTMVLVVELAIMEPWLRDALRVRALGYATPAAPLEILAIAIAFLLAKFGIIWLLAKVAFNRGWLSLPPFPALSEPVRSGSTTVNPATLAPAFARTRIERTSDSVERLVAGEQGTIARRFGDRLGDRPAAGTAEPGVQSVGARAEVARPRLGSTWRRAGRMGDRMGGTGSRTS